MSRRPASLIAMLSSIGLVLLMFTFSGVVGAQDSITVELAEGWVQDNEATGSADGIESTVYVNGNANFVVISFADGIPDVGASSSLHSSLVTDIDVGATYALRSIEAHGGVYGAFDVIVGTNVQTLFAPVSGFADAIATAQSGIEVNGAAVLQGVDGNSLAGIVMAAVDVADGADLPPLLGSSDAVTADPESTQVSDAGEAEESAPVAATSEAQSADEPSGTGEAGDVGFLDDTTFVSPQFGTRITWGAAWAPQEFGDGPEFSSYTDPNPQFSYDILCLAPTAEGVYGLLCIDIRQYSDFSGGQEYWNATYGGPDAVNFRGVPYYSVNITDDGFSAAETDLEGDRAYVRQSQISGDLLVAQQISGDLEQIADMVDDATAEVVVDGNPSLHLVDPIQFRAENDQMITDLPMLRQQRDDNMAAMGLIDPNHFVSVATGCEVSWDETMLLSGMDSMSPIDLNQNWNSNEGQEVVSETLEVWSIATGASFRVDCFESRHSMDGFWEWDDESATRFEGVVADYSIHKWSEDSYDVYMVLKPLGQPTVTLHFDLSATLTAQYKESGETGALVVQGVDIVETILTDGLLDNLP